MTQKEEKNKILKEYLFLHDKYFKSTGKSSLPREVYRLETKTPENKVRFYFGGYKGLRREAIKKLNFQTREEAEINERLSNRNGKRFIVSAVVEGAPINEDFLKAMELYAKKNNARLLLFWMKGVYRQDHFVQEEIAKLESYLITGFKFNNNLEARDFLIHPAQMLPLTGLDRFGSKKTSLIVASTKQMMTSIPRPKSDTAHVIWTTGTISTPKYSKTRTGELARQDNTLGALVVEIESDDIFYIRNVEWINDCFVDLGTAYYKDKVKKMSTEAMVWGDLHLTEEDNIAVKLSIDQTNLLKAKKILIHDLISFNSISHHMEGHFLDKTFIPHEFNTLKKELNYTKTFLNNLIKKIKSNIIVVASNHDIFLKRYADEGRFLHDAHNAVLGAECFIDYTKGLNPIEKFINRPEIKFLKQDESYIISGVETGQHGHNGSSGSKGSPMQFRKSYDRIVLGHSHQPKILNNVFYVGTLSKLNLPYMKGASAWLHANCAIYSNSSRQLILWVGNKWKI